MLWLPLTAEAAAEEKTLELEEEVILMADMIEVVPLEEEPPSTWDDDDDTDSFVGNDDVELMAE